MTKFEKIAAELLARCAGLTVSVNVKGENLAFVSVEFANEYARTFEVRGASIREI